MVAPDPLPALDATMPRPLDNRHERNPMKANGYTIEPYANLNGANLTGATLTGAEAAA